MSKLEVASREEMPQGSMDNFTSNGPASLKAFLPILNVTQNIMDL